MKISDAMKTTVRAKAQLWIGYFLLACVLVLAGFSVYYYIAKLRLDTQVATLEADVRIAEARVTEVEEVNQQQAKAIETINNITEVNDTMLKGLATDMESLRVRDRTTFNRLAALEKTNEAVRKYLNTAVPAPVGCVLDRTCPDEDTDRVPAAERGSTSSVPSSGSGSKPQQR